MAVYELLSIIPLLMTLVRLLCFRNMLSKITGRKRNMPGVDTAYLRGFQGDSLSLSTIVNHIVFITTLVYT